MAFNPEALHRAVVSSDIVGGLQVQVRCLDNLILQRITAVTARTRRSATLHQVLRCAPRAPSLLLHHPGHDPGPPKSPLKACRQTWAHATPNQAFKSLLAKLASGGETLNGKVRNEF